MMNNSSTTTTTTTPNTPLHKFQAKIKAAMKHLDEHGWALIPEVVSTSIAKGMENQFYDWYENFGGGIDRNDPSSWGKAKGPEMTHGIIKHYGIGQTQMLWDAREYVAPVFEQIYSRKELRTSLDGASFMFSKDTTSAPLNSDVMLEPGTATTSLEEKKPKKEREYYERFHTDQGNRLKTINKKIMSEVQKFTNSVGKFDCIQGILAVTDSSGENDGGLYVCDKSHLKHAEFFDRAGLEDHTENWYVYTRPKVETKDRDPKDVKDDRERLVALGNEYLDSFDKVKVNAKAGDFIIFYSRTAHCGIPPKKNGRPRIAFYISMLPASFSNPSVDATRVKYVTEFRTTSHWAALCMKVNPEVPRSYDSSGVEKWAKYYPSDKMVAPVLTSRMKQLAGFPESEWEEDTVWSFPNTEGKKRKDTSQDVEDGEDTTVVEVKAPTKKKKKESDDEGEDDDNK